MKKSNKVKATFIITIVIIAGALAYSSYLYSKKAAIELVGETIQYFPITTAKITIAPFHRKYPVWMFSFSHADIFDAEFEIYTTVFGNIEITNPKNIEHRLREIEKLPIHPYSREGIQKSYKGMKQAQTSDRITN